MKKNYKYLIPLILLFGVLLLFTYLSNYYGQKVNELNTEIFSTSEDGGFTLFSAFKVVDLPEEYIRSGLVIGLSPSGSFNGQFGIKNHDDSSHIYKVELREFERRIGDGEYIPVQKGDVRPKASLEKQDFKILGKQVEFFGYDIEVPGDIEPGEYRVAAAMTVQDSSAEFLYLEGGAKMALAVGVFLNIIVDENPPVFEYEDLSNQAREIGFDVSLLRLRYIFASLLLLITIYFVYRAFREDRSKSKK